MLELRYAIAAGLCFLTQFALAAPQLNRELTPMGSVRAGNEAGTIPKWTGGVTEPPADYKPGGHYVDPFAADKPLFTIDGNNWKEHAANLTEAHVAMFKRHPKTFRMVVYPSRRSCALPSMAYEWIERNAKSAKLVDYGFGVEGAYFATPFPIPKSGIEFLWNHLLRYRGYEFIRDHRAFVVRREGNRQRIDVREIGRRLWSNPAEDKLPDGSRFYAKSKSLASGTTDPKNRTRSFGTYVLTLDTLRPSETPRKLWMYEQKTRRTRQATDYQYSSPSKMSFGLTTIDSEDGFNGLPDHYAWNLVGRMEAYVPYNNYKFDDPAVSDDALTTSNHLNPSFIRYEIHRVWVIDGILRSGHSHIFSRRRLYLDEDTWSIVAGALYKPGRHGGLAQAQEIFTLNAYTLPACISTASVVYDLGSKSYFVSGLTGQTPPPDRHPPPSVDMNFEPEYLGPLFTPR